MGESLTPSIQAEAIASLAKTWTILFRGVKQAKEEGSQKKEDKRQTSSVFEENTEDVFLSGLFLLVFCIAIFEKDDL